MSDRSIDNSSGKTRDKPGDNPCGGSDLQLPAFLRQKSCAIDETLPPVSELVKQKRRTILRYIDLDGQEQSLDYRELTSQDPLPIPLPVDRENYLTLENSPHYWATGYGDWLNVHEAIRRFHSGAETNRPLRLLDFGCASGRFLRHSWTFGRQLIDSWGCDFAPANIQWAKRYLPSDIKFVLNNAIPHLPFPDGYFDVVTAFSVFTHIDHFEDAWLLELRRITRNDGLLYVTVQNEAAWQKISERPKLIEHLMKSNEVEGNLKLQPSSFSSPLPQDRLVMQMSKKDIYNCNVWTSNQYIREHWSRYFEILAIADNGHTLCQSPVIMRPIS